MKIKMMSMFIILTLSLSACSNKEKTDIETEIDFKNGDFAIIETSNDKSCINVYNPKGQKLSNYELDCPDINSGFSSPIEYDGKIYANSVGGFQRESNKVVEINFAKNKINFYEVAYGMFSIAKKNNFLYTTNSPPEGSIITKFNMNTNKIDKTINVSGLVSHLNLFNDKLYAFADSDKKDGTMYIYIINPDTLKIEESIIDKIGISVFNSMFVDANIFYSHLINPSDSAPSNIITKLNITNNTLTDITLKKDSPYQIKRYTDKLLISHYNPINKKGNTLTQFNYNTSESKMITFEHNLCQIEVKNDSLYAYDGNNLYLYSLSDYKLIRKVDISTKKENYRNQGFFLIK